MTDPRFIIFTTALGAIVLVGLVFTHIYAGHKVKGQLFSAGGLFSTLVGFLLLTYFQRSDITIYVANVFVITGLYLYYVSTMKFVITPLILKRF